MLPRFRISRLLAGILTVVLAATGLMLASSSATAATAGTTRALTYRGERFQVPAAWTVYNLASSPRTCVRFNRHAVYEGEEGTDPSCPAAALGVTEAVQVEPYDALAAAQMGSDVTTTTLGGQTALSTTDSSVTHRLVAALPGAGVVVTVSYGSDEALARQILDSFTASSGTPVASAASVASRARAVKAAATANPATASSATTSAASIGATEYHALGFDTCSAPSTADMRAWHGASKERVIGVYIGGMNRACGDGYLSASWVATEIAAGWRLIPLYVGRQPSCVDQGGLATMTDDQAGTQGKLAAEDAVDSAKQFDMGNGSPIYYDMEAWNSANKTCSSAVVTFVKAWTKELRALGYTSGIYGSADAGIAQDIIPIEGQTDAPRVLDFAQWDGDQDTTSDYFTAGAWPGDRRVKQFEGNVNETHGGVTINIDADEIDSIVVGNRTTITAGNRTGRGDVAVLGTTSGWAKVALYAKYYGSTRYVAAGTTVAKGGKYRFNPYLRKTAHFYVQVGGLNSNVKTSTITDRVYEYLRPEKGAVDARVWTNPSIPDQRVTFYRRGANGELTKRRSVYTNANGVVNQTLTVGDSQITIVAKIAGGKGTDGGSSVAHTVIVPH